MTIGEQLSTHITSCQDYEVTYCADIRSGLDKLDQADGRFDAFIHCTDETASADWELLDKANLRFEDICWIAYIGSRFGYSANVEIAFKSAYVEGAFDVDTLAVTLESVLPSRSV